MDYPLCKRCGLDPGSIGKRLRLLQLDRAVMRARGRDLQELVVAPNLEKIADRLYDTLAGLEDFTRIVKDQAALERVRASHRIYLKGLGIDFDRPEYFEERLRIGAAHQRVGVPQSLYLCTYQGLQTLLIEHVPQAVRADPDAFEPLLGFILKITALDMSLAVESYCMARVSDLNTSLENERGESDRLRKLAVTDWLTGLHNHSYSRGYLDAALARSKAKRSPLCVIMADLDHFKKINDANGHPVGDEILRIAAGRMTSAARTGDEFCRYGGEEFLFILESTSLSEGADVAERIRRRIGADSMNIGNKRISLTVSLGLAQASDEDTVTSLIERADRALYAAKKAGRNCVRLAPKLDRIA